MQNDADVQEIWDSAQKLTCQWTESLSKTVSVPPITINMLEATEARFSADDDVVDVWMDMQLGHWPNSSPVKGPIRIGETLSLIVGVNDPTQQMDFQVRDCYAHSLVDVTDPSALRIQLTDNEGCVLKPKLLSAFQRQYDDAGGAANVAYLNAFSFPDNSQVFTSCNVEVCKDACQPNACQPSRTEPLLPQDITTVPTTPSTGSTFPSTLTVTPFRVTTPLPPVFSPEPTLPPLEYLPPQPITRPPPILNPSTQPRPPASFPTQTPVPSFFPTVPNIPPSAPLPTTISTSTPSGPSSTPSYSPSAPPQRPPSGPPPALPAGPPPAPPAGPTPAPPSGPPAGPPPRPATAPPSVPPSGPSTAPPLVPPPGPSPVPPSVPPSLPPSGPPSPTVGPAPSTSPTAPSSTSVPPTTLPPGPPLAPFTTSPGTTLTIPPPPSTFPPKRPAAPTKPKPLRPSPSTEPTVPVVAPTAPPASLTTSKVPSVEFPTVGETPNSPSCIPGTDNPQCVVPGSSNDVTITENPVKPTKASGDGWKGDSASHAFHKFHFDRGDGRRGRNLPKNKVKRSSPVVSKLASVRLTRSVQVVAVDFPTQQNFQQRETANPFCIGTRPLVISASLTVITILVLILAVVFVSLKYQDARRQLEKVVSL